jgi:hypothetical protein
VKHCRCRAASDICSTIYELRMAHNLGHILLYRPFLHYLARPRGDNEPDHRQLRCASECIKIARETISRSDEMLAQGYLAPAAWQSVYTIFLAIVALIFYLATQKGDPEYSMVEKDAFTGIRVLASTSCQDIGSRRCLDVLKVLTRRLSRIINLDIEAIENQTPSFCQTDADPVARASMSVSPTTSVHEQLFSDSPPQQPQQTPGALVADLASFSEQQQKGSHPSMVPGDGRPPLHSRQRSATQPDPRGVPQQPIPNEPSRSNSYSVYDYTYPTMRSDSQSTPVNMPQSSMNTNAYSQPQPQDYFVQQPDMEVPFSDTFAWPFDPNVNPMNGLSAAAQGLSMPDAADYGTSHGSAASMTNGYTSQSEAMPHGYPHLQPQHNAAYHMQGQVLSNPQPSLHGRSMQGSPVHQNPASGMLSQGAMDPRYPPHDRAAAAGHGRNNMADNFLTSEDIAAFMMRINPGEEPFL